MSHASSLVLAAILVAGAFGRGDRQEPSSLHEQCPCVAGRLRSLDLVDESGRIWLTLSPTAVAGGKGLAILNGRSGPAIELGLAPVEGEEAADRGTGTVKTSNRTVLPVLRMQSPGDAASAMVAVQGDQATIALCSGGDRIGAALTVSGEKSVFTVDRELPSSNGDAGTLRVARARWTFGFDGSFLTVVDADGQEKSIDLEPLLRR